MMSLRHMFFTSSLCRFNYALRDVLPAQCNSFVAKKRCFNTSVTLHEAGWKRKSDRKLIQNFLKREEMQGTPGELGVSVDKVEKQMGMFPNENTQNLLFDGVVYNELPICHIKSSRNNTIITITDYKGEVIDINSCGREGFKNARKSTNIAAQASAVSIALRSSGKCGKHVRVKIQGLGPGRSSAVKGLTMGGLEIVSVTDNTPVRWDNFPRPRKQRRI